MKTFTTLATLLLLTGVFGYGQTKDSGQMNATTYKTFAIERNGTEMPYHVKVVEHRNYPIALDKKDQKNVNQDRDTEPAQVTKLIAVDADNDNVYEHYLVLKYDKSVTDSFEVVPTEKGFTVKVNDRSMEYFVTKGIYFINDKDQDFFTVEEFKEIG